MNISKPKVITTNDLNEFRSQSAQEREHFLQNYYKTKQTTTEHKSHDLTSKIHDLHNKLNEKLKIDGNKKYDSPTSSSSIISSSNSSSIATSDYLSGTLIDDDNSIEQQHQQKQTQQNNNKLQQTTIYSNYLNDSCVDIDNVSMITPIVTNRLDKMSGAASWIEDDDIDCETYEQNDSMINNDCGQLMTRQEHQQQQQHQQIHLNVQRSNSRDNEENSFVFLPDDKNIERFSVMSYEVLSKIDGITHIDYTVHIKEFTHLTLEQQSFKCAECKQELKVEKKARRCYYFGKLYCKICHHNHKAVIPAKLIKHLDTKKYSICENARHILDSVNRKPIFDIIYDNRELYLKSKELNECRKLRVELEHLRWYLQTCSNKQANNQFIKFIWPEDYLYETIHLYSLYDLINLKDVYLKLKNAHEFAITHVLKKCDLCSQKGFICEICKNTKPIYPFQIDVVEQCELCGNLYHKACRANSTNCMKCERLEKRNVV